MHQDLRWGAKICANLIYFSAPSPGRSDHFKIRATASKFARAWSSQRVWSVLGLNPIFRDPIKGLRPFRPSPATAMLGVWLFGIVKISWAWWCYCRRLEFTGDAWQPPWLLFKGLSLISFDFYWFYLIFFDFSLQGASPEGIWVICKLNFHCFWCFLWFHYIASSKAYQIWDFSVLLFVSCLIEFVNTLRNVYRWYLVNAFIWKGLILPFLKLSLLYSSYNIDFYNFLVFSYHSRSLSHRRIFI